MTFSKPSPLGLKRTFGFGDRLGLATAGHIDAVRGTPFLPVFAQQSVRELDRTGRRPGEVMTAAAAAVRDEGWDAPWGADADHLQTPEDVAMMAKAGYTFFTIDPSEFVDDGADAMNPGELEKAFETMAAGGRLAEGDLLDIYLDRSCTVGEAITLTLDRTHLLRAAVKYGAALRHTAAMACAVAEACDGRPFELEPSVDETATPTSPLEHLFIGLELRRLGVKIVSLAPRFTGLFEKGIDFKGDRALFAEHYARHAAVARFCGPYKLSIHSGSDKFAVYPIIGALSGGSLHVKTAGTSYLEALRVVCRTDRTLFREIVAFSRGRFEADRATYLISAELSRLPEQIADDDIEGSFLDGEVGRQILHVTYGSVLRDGHAVDGGAFRDKILDNLTTNADLYREVLRRHLGRHIELLLRGL